MPVRHTTARCLLKLVAQAALAAAAAPALAGQSAEIGAVALAAEASCPKALFGTELPRDNVTIHSQLQKLAPLAEACDLRADFHAYRGALLLSAGWLQDAATALEKALLLNPELAGAQLDFAQALAQQGQRIQARELVRQVIERPDIQPDLRQWLRDGLTTPDQAAETGAVVDSAWNWSGLIQTGLGHETNLASTTHTTSLTLYLTTGPVEVPLVDSERPQAGAALKAMAAVQGARPLGDGQLLLNLVLHGRRAQGQIVSDTQLAEGTAAYAMPLGQGNVQGSVGAHSFSQLGVYNYRDQTYGLKFEPYWRLAECKSALELGHTDQRYRSSPILDGHYQHLRLEASCRPGGMLAADTTLGITTGQDTPLDPTRPGGVKHRVDAYVRYERSLTLPMVERSGTFTAWYRYSQTRDEQVFSGLLGSDPTQTRRHDGGMGYWLPLKVGWSVGLDVGATSQKSTNSLLNIRNLSIYGGLRWALK